MWHARSPEGLAELARIEDMRQRGKGVITPPNGVLRLHNHTGLIRVGGPLGMGFRSYEEIIHQYVEFLDDETIPKIVMEINCSGGPSAGLDELVGIIRSGRGRKPQIALVRDEALSAGYILASAFDRVLLSSLTSECGSVGILIVRDPLKGESITWSSGDLKACEVREPTPERDKYIKELLAQHLEILFATLKHNRSMITDEQMKEIAKGGVFMGQRAIDFNLADAFISSLTWYTQGEIVEL